MQTLDQHLKEVGSNFYTGNRRNWFIAYTVHRDADTIDQVNWKCFLELLGGESSTVAIERMGHWAVGWVEYLLIKPTAKKKLAIAEDTLKGLSDYPVLSDDKLSELEWNNYYEWAESELGQYDNWYEILRFYEEKLNLFIGDECSEWKVIEATENHLKGMSLEEYQDIPHEMLHKAYKAGIYFINEETEKPFAYPDWLVEQYNDNQLKLVNN